MGWAGGSPTPFPPPVELQDRGGAAREGPGQGGAVHQRQGSPQAYQGKRRRPPFPRGQAPARPPPLPWCPGLRGSRCLPCQGPGERPVGAGPGEAWEGVGGTASEAAAVFWGWGPLPGLLEGAAPRPQDAGRWAGLGKVLLVKDRGAPCPGPQMSTMARPW